MLIVECLARMRADALIWTTVLHSSVRQNHVMVGNVVELTFVKLGKPALRVEFVKHLGIYKLAFDTEWGVAVMHHYT